MIVTNKRFRNRARGLLVELHQKSPGLGILVDHTVVIYDRIGHPIETTEDLLALTWFSMEWPGGKVKTISSKKMKRFFGDLQKCIKEQGD